MVPARLLSWATATATVTPAAGCIDRSAGAKDSMAKSAAPSDAPAELLQCTVANSPGEKPSAAVSQFTIGSNGQLTPITPDASTGGTHSSPSSSIRPANTHTWEISTATMSRSTLSVQTVPCF